MNREQSLVMKNIKMELNLEAIGITNEDLLERGNIETTMKDALTDVNKSIAQGLYET